MQKLSPHAMGDKSWALELSLRTAERLVGDAGPKTAGTTATPSSSSPLRRRAPSHPYERLRYDAHFGRLLADVDSVLGARREDNTITSRLQQKKSELEGLVLASEKVSKSFESID